MKTLFKLLQLDFLPRSADVALLVVRVCLGLTLLFNHGLSKLTHFSQMSEQFPDPLGLGHPFSLALSIFAEVGCSALMVLGLLGRFSALGLTINMATAFFFIHRTALSGEHSGEPAFLYLVGFAGLLVAGPGRLSLDQMLFAKGVASRS